MTSDSSSGLPNPLLAVATRARLPANPRAMHDSAFPCDPDAPAYPSGIHMNVL